MSLGPSNLRNILLAAACLVAIGASLAWIYFTELAPPEVNAALHQGIGQVMAEETSKLLEHKGRVMIVAMEASKAPELNIQLAAFEKTLKKLGAIKIERKFTLETEDKPKYRTGAGLSGRRYLRIVQKSAEAQAIVSFVGAPDLTDDEIAKFEKMPKFVAEVRSVDKLKSLFDKKAIQVAIVSRFEFPAPGTKKPRTPREWFDNRFQIVTATNAASLP